MATQAGRTVDSVTFLSSRFGPMSRSVRRAGVFAIVTILEACGGAPVLDAPDVEACLVGELGADGWSEVPLSEAGTVYGVDFGSNSVPF